MCSTMSGWYVVFKGKVPGIYSSWAECSEQVLNFKGNVHKKYSSYEQALEAFNSTINSISSSETYTSICISDNVVEPLGSRCLGFLGLLVWLLGSGFVVVTYRKIGAMNHCYFDPYCM